MLSLLSKMNNCFWLYTDKKNLIYKMVTHIQYLSDSLGSLHESLLVSHQQSHT